VQEPSSWKETYPELGTKKPLSWKPALLEINNSNKMFDNPSEWMKERRAEFDGGN
jgi:hypothetical protein